MGEQTFTERLMVLIADQQSTQRSVAMIYGAAIRAYSERVDWQAVNGAILARWSVSGLKHIKRLAWRAWEVR